MESLLNKLKNFFTEEVPDADNEDFTDYSSASEFETYEEAPKLRIVPKPQKQPQTEDEPLRDNLVQMPNFAPNRLVDYRPQRFDDMADVTNALRTGKTVILHLDEIDKSLAQRVLDFASGVVCASGCASTIVMGYVCLLIPVASISEDLKIYC